MKARVYQTSTKKLTGLGLAVSLVALTSCGETGSSTETTEPTDADSNTVDTVFYNGTVIPLDESGDTFEAIALSNGDVAKLGTYDEMESIIGDETETVDLDGNTVIPGINDSHFHITSYGLSRPPLMLDVGSDNVSSISDIRDLVETAVNDSESGEWIRGRGWDQGYLEEGRFPTKDDIDEVSQDNPVVLQEWSGHAVWANSKALEIAGVTADSTAQSGGEIITDDAGEPTGVLTEGAAQLVMSEVPEFTDEDQRTATIAAVDEMHAAGITSVTGASVDPTTMQLFSELIESGEIRQRITAMVGSAPADELRETLSEVSSLETDPEWLNINQVKIHLDGVPTQQQTAWVSEEYEDGGHGGLVLSEGTNEEQVEDLHERVAVSHEEGFSVGVHATGDRAIAASVDAFEEAISDSPEQDLRHYIIHGDLVPEDSLRTMSELDIGVNFNPSIKRSLSHQLEDVIGRDRTDYQWPYRTAIDLGVHTASSSDAPVVPPRFLEGITAMLTRESVVSGEVYGEEETITLKEALRTYTVAGAWQDGAEDWKGTLEQGMAADLVVLDGDLESTPPEEIVDMNVDTTVVGGEIVYSDDSTS